MPWIFNSGIALQDGEKNAKGGGEHLRHLLRIEGPLLVFKRPECLGTAIQNDTGEKLGVGYGGSH